MKRLLKILILGDQLSSEHPQNHHDYEKFIHEFDPELISNKNLNRNMALKAFEHVANYDISIANYLGKEIGGENFPKYQSLKKINNLRYGENPHQTASLYQNNAVRSISIVKGNRANL